MRGSDDDDDNSPVLAVVRGKPGVSNLSSALCSPLSLMKTQPIRQTPISGTKKMKMAREPAMYAFSIPSSWISDSEDKSGTLYVEERMVSAISIGRSVGMCLLKTFDRIAADNESPQAPPSERMKLRTLITIALSAFGECACAARIAKRII